MVIKSTYKMFTGMLVITVILLALMPLNVLAVAKPWDAYSQYIPNSTPIVKRDLKGTWICTVVNMDWPSSDVKKIENDDERIQKSKDEFIAILDKVVEMNMNAVFFQVSPEGDAFFKSNIVPWSRYLTGTFGKDPGFDPLAFAIEEAHKRNLELHAWFNPYRVSMDIKDSTISSLKTEKSVYKEHPEWIKTSMSRFVVDPGIPEARKWVNDRVMEVVDNYDVDGVHFDDYFYYEKFEGELKDEDTYKKYNKGQFKNIGDWRRNNTYILVKELSTKIKAKKSWVKFGISPAGVWGNKSDGLSGGSNTKSPFTNYNKSFADTKKWVEHELIDYIAPQIYFSFANPRASYGEVATWWSKICKGKKVHLYIGQALYKVNDDSDQYFKGTNAIAEFTRQLRFNVAIPEIKGSIMFRFQNFSDSSKKEVVNIIRNDLWSTKSLVPVMSWKGGKAPAAPTDGKLEDQFNGVKLSFSDNNPNTAYYAIYRYNNGEKGDVYSDASALKLLGTVRKVNNGIQEFVDEGTDSKDKVFYIVTALDRLHNESSGHMITINKSAYFKDVGQEYFWAFKDIDKLYENGVVKGDNKGMFNPGVNTKRGDFIVMVVNALNLKTDFSNNFADVKKEMYYYDAIGIAKEYGIIKGSGDLFNPESNITREDMMVIVVKAISTAGLKLETAGDENLNAYSDQKLVSSYARVAVASLSKAGIVNGAGSRINPKSGATRAEIAVILNKLNSGILERV